MGVAATLPELSEWTLTENYPTSLAYNSVIIGLNDFKFGTEPCYMILQIILKFGGD